MEKEKNKNYVDQIGDGKLPNKYWVFHYDWKFKMEKGKYPGEDIPGDETLGGLIGEFSTWEDALNAAQNEAYLPHVVIEDRLSGVVYEQLCRVCECCGKEEWETINDIEYTQETMGNDFK